MKISTRTRCGIRAVIVLSQHYGKAPLQIKTIAEHGDISKGYLQQLIRILTTDGMLRSIRGPRGGYVLTKPPEEIVLKELFLALEGPMISTVCLEHAENKIGCPDCIVNQVCQEMQDALMGVLESVTLADLVGRLEE